MCGVSGVTPGRLWIWEAADNMNMGACMAPAACDTIERNLQDFGRTPSDYDRIITGDLGAVGKRILLDLLGEKGIDIGAQHMDCGIEIYDSEVQDTHSGGSGCGCAASTLSALILPSCAGATGRGCSLCQPAHCSRRSASTRERRSRALRTRSYWNTADMEVERWIM